MHGVAAVVERTTAEANARHQQLLGELRAVEKDPRESRENLQRIRAAAFKVFAGQGIQPRLSSLSFIVCFFTTRV